MGTSSISIYLWQAIELARQLVMQLQKLAVSFLEVPAGPTRSHVDFVDESVFLEHTYLHFRHGDLG